MKTQKANLMMMPMTFAIIALSGCTGQSIPPSAADPDRAVNVELVRKKQRVVRYNCQHHIVSDSLEETSSPTQLMELKPETNYWGMIWNSDFLNLTTQDGPDLVYDHVKFEISYDSGLFMRVREGLNKIKYEFEFGDGETESGSRYVDVYYHEEILNGRQEIRPTLEECANYNN